MEETIKNQILEKARVYFKSKIIDGHIKKLKDECGELSTFKPNPFLVTYLANFLCGDSSAVSKARAIIYPFILGTSISTRFGTHFQNFISELKEIEGIGSVTPGFDIEFVDALDGERKYCQLKASPQTINHDDVDTIIKHFDDALNLARTNKRRISNMDVIVGVLYGDSENLAPFYQKIQKKYNVYVGENFWYHLTGDKDFYNKIINVVADVAKEVDCSNLLEEKIKELSKDIERKGL